MRPWLTSPAFRSILRRTSSRRASSRAHVDPVSVPCASSGNITVSLRNVSKHPATNPLVVYLPPFSRTPDGSEAGVPAFLDEHPTAVVNYRWPDLLADPAPAFGDGAERGLAAHLHWPTPIHDVLFGYDWLVRNLSPPDPQRRDVYVFGSHLGAGLAAALALTESHPHQRMAVRGLAAYNGIYNWTTFLPDHPLNKAGPMGLAGPVVPEPGGSTFHYLKQQIPGLFKTPSNLFDPFASPCLLFHTAGILVPPDFAYSSLPSPFLRAVDALSLSSSDPESRLVETAPGAPRKGYLAFPPRHSTLRIPESLLVHEPPPPVASPAAGRRRSSRRKPAGENSFSTQAEELARLMRRSVSKLEMKSEAKREEVVGGWEAEADRRIRVVDVGRPAAGFALTERGQQVISTWLEERTGSG